MAAGLGFKNFNTGEVLTSADVNGYLMQGVLVFASEAARNAAITSPQEGQFAYTKDNNSLWYYTGSAWAASGATGDIEGVTAGTGISGGGTSGTVTITNSMATEIDAKGDLIVGTGADTFARLAVGTNGHTLVADSGETTGLKWAAAGTATSYTPTLTNMSKGNGTVTASYVQVGKIVLVNFEFVLGSTSTVGTNPIFSLPVTAAADQVDSDVGTARFLDAGVAYYIGVTKCNATTQCFFEVTGAAGTYVNTVSIQAAVPFTWTTNDTFFTTICYQAA